jgi:hypothetical protein
MLTSPLAFTILIFENPKSLNPQRSLTHRSQAKILRMSNDPQGAIAVLQRALEAPQTFVQADTLVRSFSFFVFFDSVSFLYEMLSRLYVGRATAFSSFIYAPLRC